MNLTYRRWCRPWYSKTFKHMLILTFCKCVIKWYLTDVQIFKIFLSVLILEAFKCVHSTGLLLLNSIEPRFHPLIHSTYTGLITAANFRLLHITLQEHHTSSNLLKQSFLQNCSNTFFLNSNRTKKIKNIHSLAFSFCCCFSFCHRNKLFSAIVFWLDFCWCNQTWFNKLLLQEIMRKKNCNTSFET